METVDAYPLTWPVGQPRTKWRKSAAFKLSMADAGYELSEALRLLGAKNVVISSNLRTRRDGIPLATQNEPEDPGVAVYFTRQVNDQTKSYVIACDTYRKAVWNLRAVGVTIDAMRKIARHGSLQMLEQAFTGFAALPPKSNKRTPSWHEVLEVSAVTHDFEAVKASYKRLSLKYHPDRGGDPAKFKAIQEAWNTYSSYPRST